jgi:hypothetical protein
MIPTDLAIARLKRDLTLSSALKFALLGAAISALFIDTLIDRQNAASLLLAAVAALWLLLSYRSVRGSRIADGSAALIASGNLDQAEQTIDQALRAFSLFRTVKLRTFHHLAMLRHAQRRFPDAVLLGQTLLSQRLGPLAPLSRSTQLILADSLLELGDLPGAYHALNTLYQHRLPLGEALELLSVQTDYLAQIAAWPAIIAALSQKADLTELLPAPKSARLQALLALAARKTGHPQWENWLRRRAELLADPNELIRQRPLLAELWTNPTSQTGTGHEPPPQH